MSAPDLRKRYTRVGPVRIAHYDVGAGPAILFVHGIPSSAYLWRETIGGLRDRFRCLAPDLLGLGDTEAPLDVDYTPPAQAELLRGLLDAKGIDRVHLVCHDQGCAAAQNFVARYPDRVDRWVVVDGVTHDNWPVPVVRALQGVARHKRLYDLLARLGVGQAIARGPAGFRRAVSRRGALGDAVEEYLRPVTRGVRPRSRLRDARERLRRFALAGDARHTLDVLPALRGFPRPVMVLWGAEDKFLAPASGRRLAEELQDATFELVPDCGHFLPEERPDLLIERLQAFLPAPAEAIA